MKLTMKRAAATAAAVLIAVTAWATFRNGGVEVVTATVGRDTLSVTVPVEGRTRARDLFTVAAPVAGQLVRIELDEGTAVDEGDVLARIRPAPEDPRTEAALRADLQAARASLQQAEAGVAEAAEAHEQAVREAERRNALEDLGALSREVIERARTSALLAERALEAARATRDAAAARVEAARARLLGVEGAASAGRSAPLTLDVMSPVAGRVLRVPDPSARVVPAGAPLVELADVRGLELVFDVLSEDAVRIEPGQEIEIREWGGSEPLTGRVRTVTLAGYTKVSALGVEEQRVDIVGDLDHTPASLGSGYRVGGDVVVWHEPDVLSVPTAAVFRSEGGWTVFEVVDGRAEIRVVELGQRNQERAQVVSGLGEGAEVVLFPPATLEPGGRVRVTSPPR